MRGDGFVLPDTKRLPGVFAALGLMFLAMVGRVAAPLLGEGTAYLAALMGLKTGQTGLNALVSFYYYAFFMILPLGIYLYLHRGAGEYIRFKPLSGRHAVYAVLCGAAGVIFASVISVFWTDFIYALGLRPGQGAYTASSTSELALMILLSAVIPALCEDLLCRGMVLSAYEDRGTVNAVMISAAWFACLHASVEGLPAEFISGLGLGLITVFTGSVFAGIIYHTVHNSVILILNYALSSAASAPEAAEAAAQASQSAGSAYPSLIMLGLASGLTLYLLFRRLYRSGGEKALLPPEPNVKRDTLETIVLVCVITLGAIFYIMDILDMTVLAS
ncbi:MAG: CPBP family intramembrane metalloprotease [Clostridia bacterium]|nr:CPBP family intramembrane metalloprotease [Clostridia bacterium]